MFFCYALLPGRWLLVGLIRRVLIRRVLIRRVRCCLRLVAHAILHN
jgi:hypothetical protein